MNQKLDLLLFRCISTWTKLTNVPLLRLLGALTEPITSPLMVGYLRRQAVQLEAGAEKYKEVNPEAAQEFRLMAAQYRQEAHELER